MNLGIVFINIYYLVKIYRSKEYFKILPIESNSQYFNYFLDYYKKGIENYASTSKLNIDDSHASFYILRNMVPAGVFIASQYDENTLKVDLDFVIPEYRDFKIGKYIYEDRKDYFLKDGYSKFICFSLNDEHNKYLKKMGFEEAIVNGENCFVKSITK